MSNDNNSRSLRTRHLRYRERKIAKKLIEAYQDLAPTVGSQPCVDYSQVSSMYGAKGAQYRPFDGQGFRVIDFLADVLTVAENSLDTNEMGMFRDAIAGNADWTRQSEEFVVMTEKVGRAFRSNGLYPVRGYFKGALNG